MSLVSSESITHTEGTSSRELLSTTASSLFSGELLELVTAMISKDVFKDTAQLTTFHTILLEAYPIFKGDSTDDDFLDGDFDQGRSYISLQTSKRLGRSIDVYNIFDVYKVKLITIETLYQCVVKPS
jgi:hypothetical protein